MLYRQKRETRTTELVQEISQYNDQIDAELGPAFEQVNREIDDLNGQIDGLQAERIVSEESENRAVEDRKVAADAADVIEKAAADAAKAAEESGSENSNAPKFAGQIEKLEAEQEDLTAKVAELNQQQSELTAQIRELEAQVKAKEEEREDLEADPWIRRLRRRVEDKEAEIETTAAEIERNTSDTDNDIAKTEGQTEDDIQAFEALRATLKKELKRAKLKRELDRVDALSDAAVDTANRRYEETESQLYQQLLAAMYSNEEKIFQSRLSAIRLDSEDRKFDYETEYKKSIEVLEEDFALQERFLKQKISDLKRAAKEKAAASETEDDETEDPELTAAEEELARKTEEHETGMADLEVQRKDYLEEESQWVDRETTTVRIERTRVRLIFLQTDDPFHNTSATLAFRNLGTPIKFASESFPLPMMMSIGISYTALNIDNHSLRLSLQADMPFLFAEGVPFYQDISVGAGLEYSFFNLAFIRGGYTFNNIERSFAAGFGLRLGLGFTEYTVDYTFRPLPDYGFVHSFGVSISF